MVFLAPPTRNRNRFAVYLLAACLSLFVTVAIALFAGPASASCVGKVASITATSLAEVGDQVERFLKSYKPHEILVLYDFDNVLARPPTHLGSEAWFYNFIVKMRDPNWSHSLVQVYEDLLLLQRLLLEEIASRPVDRDMSREFQRIHDAQVHSMVLTSRSPTLLGAILRDLKLFKIDFSKTAPGPKGGFDTTFLPYHPDHIETSGLTADEFRDWNLMPDPKIVAFRNGIYMTRGQDKGAMARILLKKINYSPKAIIFVDDALRHVSNVSRAFDNQGIDVVTIHLQHPEKVIDELTEEQFAETERELEKHLDVIRERMKDKSPMRLLEPGTPLGID